MTTKIKIFSFFLFFGSLVVYAQLDLPNLPSCSDFDKIQLINIDSLVLTKPLASFCSVIEVKRNTKTRNEKIKLAKQTSKLSDKLFEASQYNDAINFETLTGQIWFELDSIKNYTVSIRRLGSYYYRLGDIYNTVKYINPALVLSRKNNQKLTEYLCLYRLAWANWRINNCDEAIKYIQLSKKLIDEGYVKKNLGSYYNSISNFYRCKDDFLNAIKTVDKAIELSKNSKLKGLYGVAVTNKAHYLLDSEGDAEAIIKMIFEALEINKEMNDLEQLGSNYGLLAKAYIYNKEYDKAIKFALISELITKKIGDLPRVLRNYTYLKEAYLKKNNYHKAFIYSEKYNVLYKTLYGTKNINKIFELQRQKSIQLNAVTIQNIKRTNKKNKLIYWLTTIISILTLFGLLAHYKNLKNNQKRKNEALKVKSSNELLQMEMEALRARMNPHFLFNSLNSIKSYIIKSDPKNASDYLTKFATLVRMILNHSKEKTISLSDELIAISYYIEIEKMRLKDMFEYRLEVADEINLDEIQIPPSILQPFVENAIWHGFMGLKKNGLLSITISQIEDETVITIQDNGIGRKATEKLKLKKEKHKSTGLKIIDNTIEVYKKKDILDLHIEIIDLFDDGNKPSGTKICIAIKN